MQLISIHIPKTAGTSFYAILSQVYNDLLSPSFKRRDIQQLQTIGEWRADSPALPYEVMHGHFRYEEITEFVTSETVLICWLRDPIQRLISNYYFFKTIFTNPERNPANYERNKHRINETLEEYASLAENQNRICEFLSGSTLDDFAFIGHIDHFDEDVADLSHKLSWPVVRIPYKNRALQKKTVPTAPLMDQLIAWNKEDILLYCDYLERRSLIIPEIYRSVRG